MKNVRLIDIDVLSWSTKNPGVNNPGFCTIFADGEVESPYFVTCFGIARNTGGSVSQGDYVVTSGYTSQMIKKEVKAAINAVVSVSQNNRMFALAGEYAFYYNLIARTIGIAGQRIIVSENLPDYKLIRSIAEDVGFHVSNLAEASDKCHYHSSIIIDRDIDRLRAIQKSIQMVMAGDPSNITIYDDMSISKCNDLGKGFDDERYQNGLEVYPEHYIHGLVKHNLLNACEYIEKNKIEYSEYVSILETASKTPEQERGKLNLKNRIENDLLITLQSKFVNKICPGVLELVDSTEGNLENSLAFLASVAMCGVEKTNVCRNSNSTVLTGILRDGSLFSVFKTQQTKGDFTLYFHYENNTYVLDSNGLRHCGVKDEKTHRFQWDPEKSRFNSFEDSEEVKTWENLLKRIEGK